MSVRNILQLGDPRLRTPCARVSDPRAKEVLSIVQDLTDTLAATRAATGYGRAIAAPQIGELLRIVLVRLPGEDAWPLINPVIVERSRETEITWDSCLSFLCIFMRVERHRWVRLRYQDLQGVTHELIAAQERNLGELLQHELDHLDGVLGIDRVTDLRSICTREEFEQRYRQGTPYARPG